MLSDKEFLVKRVQIQKVFKPGSPTNKVDLFAGRIKELESLISVVLTEGQHAIIFGERGVGKTSLASTAEQLFSDKVLKEEGIGHTRFNCDSDTDFSQLWRRIFRALSATLNHNPTKLGFSKKDDVRTLRYALENYITEETFSPDDIRIIFEQKLLGMLGATIILDEVDRITDTKTRRLLADTIKALSDYGSRTTLILVGVADDVDKLIGEHQSIERALVQIPLSRMSSYEISDLLNKCLNKLSLDINDEARDFIVMLSRGLPHYAHLLGQNAALEAVKYNRKRITERDVEEAIHLAIGNNDQTLKSQYFQAIRSNTDTLYADVLLACSLAVGDADNKGSAIFFSAADVKTYLSEIRGKPYAIRGFTKHLAELSSQKRNIIERFGEPRSYQYRFTNPLMQPFILMKGWQDEKITYKRLLQVLGRDY